MKWRSLCTLVALFYVYGHPIFDGYRPITLNEPFHEFHTEVRTMASDYGTRVVRRLHPIFENGYTQIARAVAGARIEVQQAARSF
jgi:hypothetical protein